MKYFNTVMVLILFMLSWVILGIEMYQFKEIDQHHYRIEQLDYNIKLYHQDMKAFERKMIREPC